MENGSLWKTDYTGRPVGSISKAGLALALERLTISMPMAGNPWLMFFFFKENL